MKWYFPSWNGDVRVEAVDDLACQVTVVTPTPGELAALTKLEQLFVKKGWLAPGVAFWGAGASPQKTQLRAPLKKVAPVLVKALKQGRETLTAVVLKDGRVETVTGSDQVALEPLAAKAAEEGKAAATVKRPTPCCPQCYEDAIGPATDVLLDFLSPEQHEDWARQRAFIVRGSVTGVRYLLSHRHGRYAGKYGKICRDIDNEITAHFHDHTVPPEEEVLAAKLCLEHAEAWLRNEATMLSIDGIGGMTLQPNALGLADKLKNPFGGVGDGTWSTGVTKMLGGFFQGLHVGLTGKQPTMPDYHDD